MSFKVLHESAKSQARVGELKTKHGVVKTPFFMPIATRGSVKALLADDLRKLDAQIVLANTYHLFLKPGLKVLKKAGGLHRFMDWTGPILTDSGGYQVFSLRDKNNREGLVKLTGQGVEFKSVYDGSRHLFTPKKVLDIQKVIASDIRMVLDVCSPARSSKERAAKDLELTLDWARKSRRQKTAGLLFGIIQGALFKDLRLKSVAELVKLKFDGYAIGGLAVGESARQMYEVLDYTVPELPKNKPRYLMGVGYPEQISEAVKRGVDMFDCVIPTREARHGRLYLSSAKGYLAINIKSRKFANDSSMINAKSALKELRSYSKAYLRHLFSVGEPLALRLATLNNLEFYLKLMSDIRREIKLNKF